MEWCEHCNWLDGRWRFTGPEEKVVDVRDIYEYEKFCSICNKERPKEKDGKTHDFAGREYCSLHRDEFTNYPASKEYPGEITYLVGACPHCAKEKEKLADIIGEPSATGIMKGYWKAKSSLAIDEFIKLVDECGVIKNGWSNASMIHVDELKAKLEELR